MKMDVCVCLCVRACVRVRACMQACVRACVHVCVRACVRKCGFGWKGCSLVLEGVCACLSMCTCVC